MPFNAVYFNIKKLISNTSYKDLKNIFRCECHFNINNELIYFKYIIKTQIHEFVFLIEFTCHYYFRIQKIRKKGQIHWSIRINRWNSIIW